MNFQILTIFILFISTLSAHALPIDWHGTLGFDTTSIDNYRRLDGTADNSNNMNAGNRGTQEVPLGPGGNANASWQSYVFSLEPTIVVNDAASIKAELSSGYGRGGRLGTNGTQSQEPGFGNALYPYNFSDGNDSLIINKLYMELYADTATYVIGRHTNHYGLGAVVNAGEDVWDRFSFIRDGITLKVKLGSFAIEPFWTRVGSSNSLTKATRIKEYGFSLVYDNVDRDMAFGLLYTKKKNAPFSSDYQLAPGTDLPSSGGGNYNAYGSLGKTDVKLTDIYFSKSFGFFDFGIEVPILSGEIGSVFGNGTKYKSRAIIFESNASFSDNFSVGIDAGQVSGDDGSSSSFEAMYLNPNYQIANLLFRYNLRGIGDPDDASTAKSVYDSYLHNTRYIKLKAKYSTEKWIWDFAVIQAWAEQTAQAGKFAYNHTTNKRFAAVTNQKDDLGTEFDINFDYKWNNEINIGGAFGYLMTGDYFAFNNTTNPNKVDNSYVIQLKTAISF